VAAAVETRMSYIVVAVTAAPAAAPESLSHQVHDTYFPWVCFTNFPVFFFRCFSVVLLSSFFFRDRICSQQARQAIAGIVVGVEFHCVVFPSYTWIMEVEPGES